VTKNPGPSPRLPSTSDPRSGRAEVQGDRELVDVVWRRFGLHVFLTYAGGDREHLTGDLVFAMDMAQDAGLKIVESSAAAVHWAKAVEASQSVQV